MLAEELAQEADLVFIQGPAMISYLSIYYAHRYGKKTFFYIHTLSWELFEKFFPRIFFFTDFVHQPFVPIALSLFNTLIFLYLLKDFALPLRFPKNNI